MKAYSPQVPPDLLAACKAVEETRVAALSFGVSELWVRRVK
jgi:hypothetical protein